MKTADLSNYNLAELKRLQGDIAVQPATISLARNETSSVHWLTMKDCNPAKSCQSRQRGCAWGRYVPSKLR